MTFDVSAPGQVIRAGTVAAVALLGVALGSLPAVAEEIDADAPYVLVVRDAAAKTGERAMLVATLRMKDGYRFLDAYNNRVVELSSADDGVVFERKSFLATLQGDELVFNVALKPTKAGPHPINGVLRVGYAKDTTMMRMVTVPLIATVTGSD